MGECVGVEVVVWGGGEGGGWGGGGRGGGGVGGGGMGGGWVGVGVCKWLCGPVRMCDRCCMGLCVGV